MCWSGPASASIATLGFVSTAYAIRKKESPLLWLPLVYFSLMEALQAFTYSVIDHCDLRANQVATLLGNMHIAFQPFFVNMVALYFVPPAVARRVAPFAFTLCFFASVMILMKIYPLPWSGWCNLTTRPMCAKELCSFHGTWHIAWHLPLNDFGNFIPCYLIAGFIFPLIYGSWRWTLYHLITGPVLARLTTSNLSEWPAIWCLFSIDLLLIITNTPVRNYLHVKRWWFWDKIVDNV